MITCVPFAFFFLTYVNPNCVLPSRNLCLAPRPPLVSSSIAVDTVVDPQSYTPSSSPTVVGIAALPSPPQPCTGDSDAPLPPSALMWLRHSTYFGIRSLQCWGILFFSLNLPVPHHHWRSLCSALRLKPHVQRFRTRKRQPALSRLKVTMMTKPHPKTVGPRPFDWGMAPLCNRRTLFVRSELLLKLVCWQCWIWMAWTSIYLIGVSRINVWAVLMHLR